MKDVLVSTLLLHLSEIGVRLILDSQSCMRIHVNARV